MVEVVVVDTSPRSYRGFPTEMVLLKYDIYSRDIPFWSETLDMVVVVVVVVVVV